MLELLQSLFLTYGYLLLFFSSILEGVLVTGFFVPGGLIVLLGGYFARGSEISFVWVVVFSWIGMFIGDVINYYFGKSIWEKYFSKRRFFARVAEVHVFGQEEKMRSILSRWGTWAIFYSHVVGALRSVIGFVAGVSGFPTKRYLWATMVASLAWSLLFTGVGYFVAEATSDLTDLNGTITFLSLGILIFVVILRGVASVVVTFLTSRYVAAKAQRKAARVIEKASLMGQVAKVMRRFFS